jgi:hypothetical protein
MSVEGSRWTKFRDRVEHAVETAGKAALEKEIVGAAIAAAGKKR